MDQTILVKDGQALINALDKAGTPPRFAMWVHSPDTDTWKLWIVPDPSVKDKRDFYRRIVEAISKTRATPGGIEASDAEMVDAAHPAMAGLARFIKAPGLTVISFSGNTFNGYYLPDGIILRADL